MHVVSVEHSASMRTTHTPEAAPAGTLTIIPVGTPSVIRVPEEEEHTLNVSAFATNCASLTEGKSNIAATMSQKRENVRCESTTLLLLVESIQGGYEGRGRMARPQASLSTLSSDVLRLLMYATFPQITTVFSHCSLV